MKLVCIAAKRNQETFIEAAELIGVDVSFKTGTRDDTINVYTTTSAKVGLLYKAHSMLTESVSTQSNGRYRFVSRYTKEEIKAACVS